MSDLCASDIYRTSEAANGRRRVMRINTAKRTSRHRRRGWRVWATLLCVAVAGSVLVSMPVSARVIVPHPFEASPHYKIASQHWTFWHSGNNPDDGPKFTLRDLNPDADGDHEYWIDYITYDTLTIEWAMTTSLSLASTSGTSLLE